MMYRVYAAFIMSLGVAVSLVGLASDQAFGRSAVANASASMHPTFRPSFRPPFARSLNHHNRRNREIFFPAIEAFPFDGASYGDFSPPISGPISGGPLSNDINYTYKYDVPWDWAHRFPPGFFGTTPESSSSSSSVPGCSVQTVTVPGTAGKEQTINMVRC
jgi:hypothetical protein